MLLNLASTAAHYPSPKKTKKMNRQQTREKRRKEKETPRE
jgi:hypothetical protein